MGQKNKAGAGSFLFNLWQRAKAKAEAQAGNAAGKGGTAVQAPTDDGKSLFHYWLAWKQESESGSVDLEDSYDKVEKELFDDAPPEEYAWTEERRALKDTLRDAARRIPAQGKTDASFQILLSKDRMIAWLFLFPPLRGGNGIDPGAVIEAVASKGICFGLRQDTLQDAIENRRYFQVITIALGKPAGRDGRVIDCVERNFKAKVDEDEHGVVNYKNLNQFQNIAEGDIICRIVKPVEDADGKTVCGETARGRPGKPADIPAGPNTAVSHDGTALVAAKGGHIVFENGVFHVQNVLDVGNDVDISVGNIEFMGDVIIHGDVREGFSVHARGDIIVEGMSEDAILIAGGSVAIAKGMNGNGNGRIEAGSDVKCKYLENCTIYAGGNIFADSIICCEVLCDASVKVLSGKGVIIGGSLTVLGSIEAKAIGSKSNRVTDILLGATPKLIEHKEQLAADLTQLRNDLEEVTKDIAYMEKNESSLNAQRAALLEEMRAQQPALVTREAQMSARLEKIEQDLDNVGACRILCDAIFPRTRVTIGHDSLPIVEIAENCMIYYSEGKVVLGSRM